MARVYRTFDYGEARVRVALVDDPGAADLLVHRVGTWGTAHGDALWYLTGNKQDATVWVYFGSIGASDVKVYFVDSYGQAGWQRPHRLKGRFG
ncbi:MAG: hypothetical protein HY308_02895 [Gammaproteobacteria bacterium]|nr:hypothetical protein [Gammaproteobacteria bacterium]